jgi:hypothetical protein
MTMKNAVFWDVALCRSCVNRRFGGTFVHTKLHSATYQMMAFFTLHVHYKDQPVIAILENNCCLFLEL